MTNNSIENEKHYEDYELFFKKVEQLSVFIYELSKVKKEKRQLIMEELSIKDKFVFAIISETLKWYFDFDGISEISESNFKRFFKEGIYSLFCRIMTK